MQYLSILASLVMGAGVIRYVTLVVQKKVQPVLSTWLAFSIATTVISLSYIVAIVSTKNSKKVKKEEIINGLVMVLDPVLVWFVTLTTITKAYAGIYFRPFEKWFLAGALIIIVFWVISRKPIATNLLMQGLIALGHFSTIYGLAIGKASEPFSGWAIFWVGSFIYLLAVAREGNLLTKVYALRSVILLSIILLLIKYT